MDPREASPAPPQRPAHRFGPLFLLVVAFAPLTLGLSLTLRSAEGERERPRLDLARAREVLSAYAERAHAAYADSVTLARVLRTKCDSLVAAPSERALDDAREAWRAARVPYLQTEVLRFYGGPIDAVETLLNTWPVDEAYIESEDGTTGLIGDAVRYPELDAELLAASNLKEGETSVSTGYHAIEFLLWGRDRSLETPGQRSAQDFARDSRLSQRRGLYLRMTAELLVRELEGLEEAWKANEPENYRARFLAGDPEAALARVIKGMGSLGGVELAGERLTVPYQTKDQENEHSCFSDNTRDDIVFDAQGIENVCLGRYRRIDGSELRGPGLCDFIGKANGELGVRLKEQISRSVERAREIPAPFDRAILGKDGDSGRVAIARTIADLGEQTDTLTAAAAELGLGPQLASAGER